MEQQKLVKSKDRVDNFGEVFTPIETVNDMLNDIPPEMFRKDKTFLEPSCGVGVFLVEILKRKLENINTKKDAIWCISTLYGIDIQKDNVIEARNNLFELWKEWSNARYNELDNAVQNILMDNIIVGDFLDGKNIELTEYEFSEISDDVIIKTEKYGKIIRKYWQI